MRSAHFLPGAETGAQQFGISGKGRFFTVGTFFERLEMQGSKFNLQISEEDFDQWAAQCGLEKTTHRGSWIGT
jgi:hypothetical protein